MIGPPFRASLYRFNANAPRSDLLPLANRSKDTAVGDVFENRGKKMQFLFDYGDDHRFELEARGFDETMPGVVYPRLMSAKGELGPQYPDYNDDDFK
jgi:hypothetical protein